uniref:Large ribosomal subunit protein uL29c n=1 Tax=Rhodymenia pseudopalmata TaxID=31502 RepID=A0A1C9C7X4_RHOPU|nr:ribosomal protein L29 [Rhodymenia pseudopalmata]AOM64471.1 ribosomal protein L29 [Rhodymenia pseudopalmata]
MPFQKINEIKNLSPDEISKKIINIKKEIFNLKFQQATKQKIKPHIFKHKKHELAQILMLETKNING